MGSRTKEKAGKRFEAFPALFVSNMHSHILFTQPFQIPIESRIGDVYAVCIQNFGLAGSASAATAKVMAMR